MRSAPVYLHIFPTNILAQKKSKRIFDEFSSLNDSMNNELNNYRERYRKAPRLIHSRNRPHTPAGLWKYGRPVRGTAFKRSCCHAGPPPPQPPPRRVRHAGRQEPAHPLPAPTQPASLPTPSLRHQHAHPRAPPPTPAQHAHYVPTLSGRRGGAPPPPATPSGSRGTPTGESLSLDDGHGDAAPTTLPQERSDPPRRRGQRPAHDLAEGELGVRKARDQRRLF